MFKNGEEISAWVCAMLYKMSKLRNPITSHNPNTTKTMSHHRPIPNSPMALPSIRGCIDKILRKNVSPKIKCKVWI